MRFTETLSLLIVATATANAFVLPQTTIPLAFHKSKLASGSAIGSVTDELGIPCEDDCALERYPSLPESVHPGVLSGKAMVDLLEHAKENGYAIPAVNCISSSSINSCLEAARANDAPIIIQFSSGGSQFYGGKDLDNSNYSAAIAGAVSGAFHVRVMAEQYGVPVILHTDHCAKKLLPWIDGLLEASQRYHDKHGEPLFFISHA